MIADRTLALTAYWSLRGRVCPLLFSLFLSLFNISSKGQNSDPPAGCTLGSSSKALCWPMVENRMFAGVVVWCIWFPGTQLLKSLDFPKGCVFLYTEQTGGWQPPGSFRMGAGLSKDQGKIRGLGLCSPTCCNSQGGGRGWGYSWSPMASALIHCAYGMKSSQKPKGQGLESFQIAKCLEKAMAAQLPVSHALPKVLFIWIFQNILCIKPVQAFLWVLWAAPPNQPNSRRELWEP